MRFPRVLLVVVSTALLPASGCGPSETVDPEPAATVEVATDAAGGAEAVSDTATEVAFYGLISWSTERDDGGRPTRLVALMPKTSSQPECLGGGGDPLEPHHPVLKVVTGSISWDGDALEEFQGRSRIFSIAGRDVTIENGAFEALATERFELLASTARLNELKSAAVDAAPALTLDTGLLADVLATTEERLGARVSFTQGKAVAGLIAESVEHCKEGSPRYLAKPDTDQKCPPGNGVTLADQVVVGLHSNGAPVTFLLTRWQGSSEPKTHRLTVSPEPGSGVRVEIGHQAEIGALHLDTRLPTAQMCGDDHADQRDYTWYYDLRQAGTSCPAPTLHPCPRETLGGTICPQNGGG